MSNTSWGPTTPEAAARRAGGRRRYNAERHADQALRRYRITQMLPQFGLDHGSQAAMADVLGVHRSTVCRDLKAIFEDKTKPCITCGTRLTPEQWKKADRWERGQWSRTGSCAQEVF